MRQHIREIAARAIALVAGDEAGERVRQLASHELIVRESCGCASDETSAR